MPSVIQSYFLRQVVPTSISICDDIVQEKLDGTCHNHVNSLNFTGFVCDFCDEWDSMLIAAYFELILPLFLIGGSFFFRKDVAYVACLNLPAVLSIIAGSLFLPLDSKMVTATSNESHPNLTLPIEHMKNSEQIFKAHIAMSLLVTLAGIGSLCCQVALRFSGKQSIDLIRFIVSITACLIVLTVPIVSMAIGWTYAFGDCSPNAPQQEICTPDELGDYCISYWEKIEYAYAQCKAIEAVEDIIDGSGISEGYADYPSFEITL